MDEQTIKRITKILAIILLALSIFLGYQIIRIMFGGSWRVEEVMTALFFFNLGVIFTMGMMLATIKSDLRHLSKMVDANASKLSAIGRDLQKHLARRK